MNNSFEQCISDICGLELSQLLSGGKYSVYGNHVAVVEGHKGVADYQSTIVCFNFGKYVLEISGSELKLRYLEKHYAVVCGEISKVTVKHV